MYYYFSINTQNLSKKVIPGKAYVNGIETEYVKGLSRGEYLIKKELVKEPLEIRIESIPAYLVHVEQFKYCDVLALEKEKVSLSILDYEFNEFCINGYKPHFTFYKAGTKEEIKLAIQQMKKIGKCALILYTKQGSRDDLGRPTISPIDNKANFMKQFKK